MASKAKRKRGKDEEAAEICDRTRDSTLVTPASQVKCKQPGMMKLLQDIVKEANRVAFFACDLANAHVTKCLERQLPVPTLDGAFFKLCTMLVSSKVTTTWSKAALIGLDQTYRDIWGDVMQIAPGRNHWSIPLYAANVMATMASNFDTVALYDHMVPYIQAKYGITVKGHAKWICGQITSSDPLAYETCPERLNYIDAAALFALIEEEAMNFWHAHDYGRILDYRYYMMRVIRERSTDERTWKGFTILPVRGMGLKFVDLDIQAMRGIWARLKPTTGTDAVREWQRIHDEGATWDKWIHVPKRGKGWRLGKLIRTNGFEFHVLFERNKVRGPKRAKRVPRHLQLWESDFDPVYDFRNTSQVDVENPSNFHAVDPGHYNVVTVVSPSGNVHANGSPEMLTRSFSKERWAHETKRNKVNAAKERLSRSKRIKEVEDMLSAHTLKTPVYAEVCASAEVRWLAWEEIWEHYGNRQYQKLKVAARMAERKTLDGLADWIKGTKAKQPIGWGDGANFSGFKGTSPGGPVKRIRRHLVKTGHEVVMVREAYTSKRSPEARGHDMVPMRARQLDGSVKTVNGLLICQGSGKTWNRDVSAGVNIFDVFYNQQVKGEERPWHLNKTWTARPSGEEGTWWTNWSGFPRRELLQINAP